MTQRTTTKPALPQMKPAQLRTFHAALTAWYEAHGRHDLPWRNTDDAYHIWLSEVMLQQTQVATVLARFYHPFLQKFPTLEALAAAPREQVMKAWEGLGYYTRAANLHKAAQTVTDAARATQRNAARMPHQFDGLLALPGIGRNTAHAILAFAYHQPVAILEANVKRIVARIFALETPTDDQLWSAAATLLDTKNPFHHNQAMMDLGSLLCTPKNPACTICPANRICLGKTAPENYPQKKLKKQVPTREVIITVHRDKAGRMALTKRDDRLLGGLYGFPQTPLENPPPSRGRERGRENRTHTPSAASPRPSPARGEGAVGTVTHVYSHFKLIGHVVIASTTQTDATLYTPDEINALPLSKVDHKVLALLNGPQKNTQVRHAQKRHTGRKKPSKPRA